MKNISKLFGIVLLVLACVSSAMAQTVINLGVAAATGGKNRTPGHQSSADGPPEEHVMSVVIRERLRAGGLSFDARELDDA